MVVAEVTTVAAEETANLAGKHSIQIRNLLTDERVARSSDAPASVTFITAQINHLFTRFIPGPPLLRLTPKVIQMSDELNKMHPRITQITQILS